MSIVVDLILSALLVAMLVASFIMHRKIDIIKSAQGDMQSLIAELNSTCENAQTAISNLRTVYRETGDALSNHINQGKKLVDELGIILNSGEHLANNATKARLERHSTQPGKAVFGDANSAGMPTDQETKALAKLLQGLR